MVLVIRKVWWMHGLKSFKSQDAKQYGTELYETAWVMQFKKMAKFHRERL